MRRCATTLESEMTDEEREFLTGLLRQQLTGPLAHNRKLDAHLEVGTAAGGTLCVMMNSFSDDERPEFVVVDRMSYFDNQEASIRQNLQNNGLDPEEVCFHKTTSSQAFKDCTAAKRTFDFVLVDASHKIMAVTADLRWSRMLNPGGIICFHDYAERFPGVQMPVDRFLERQPNYQRIGLTGTLLALRKTAESQRPEVSTSDRIHSMLMHIPLEIERKRAKNQRKAKAA